MSENQIDSSAGPDYAASSREMQYLRRCQLLIGTTSGEALDVSLLRIKFDVTATTRQTPKSANIRVYNLADATAQLIKKEYAPIRLSVAYSANAWSTIFNGNAMFIRHGRETPVDTYLDLVCADGDSAYTNGVINTTLAAGHSPAEVVAAACTTMNPWGVTQGQTDGLPATQAIRGRAMYGMARSTLRDVARSTNTTWAIENGKVVILPEDGYRSIDVVQLNSATGMIGMPQQTPDGIVIRTLLNPRIRFGNKVQINNSDIQRAQVGTSPEDRKAAAFLPRITDDGFYKVLVVQYRGDTRGPDWSSDLICVAPNDGPTTSFATHGYLPSG